MTQPVPEDTHIAYIDPVDQVANEEIPKIVEQLVEE